MVTKINTQITTYRTKNNYFVRAIENELRILTTLIADLKDERLKPATSINFLFLLQAELQVTRHENILTEMFQLAEKSNNDPTYHNLLEMVDILLSRAYQDIGMLVVHQKSHEGKAIEEEIKKIEALEQKLKSLNYKNTPEEVQKVVEQILSHERLLEEELYRIEHIKVSVPTNP